MPEPITGAEFLALAKKSKVVADAVIDRYAASRDMLHKTAEDLARQMVVDGHLTLFQANHLLKGRYKNFFIGKYKVLMPIGVGGGSQVFLCEHSMMKHRVAVKMLKLKDNTDKLALNRFMREARAAATLNHPNVVRAYDFDKAEGRHYYIVLDYVDGVSLEELVNNVGPLPPAQAVSYVLQAAAGMQHIHDAGLIHRDIKPGNLLLDRAGVVRILDLGLVRFAESEDDEITKLQKDNVILGTADYLSPEQALRADDLDIRSDIYSLGVTLYFLLAGHTPFANLTVAQKLLYHQFQDPPPIDGVPADLFEVVLTMMAKKPEDRYQTPDEVADVLSGWAAVPLPPPDEAYFTPAGRPSATPSNPRKPQPAPTWVPPQPQPTPIINRPKPRAAAAPPRPAWLVPAAVAAAVVLVIVLAVVAFR
jgi:serine/threonine protein kinase